MYASLTSVNLHQLQDIYNWKYQYGQEMSHSITAHGKYYKVKPKRNNDSELPVRI